MNNLTISVLSESPRRLLKLAGYSDDAVDRAVKTLHENFPSMCVEGNEINVLIGVLALLTGSTASAALAAEVKTK